MKRKRIAAFEAKEPTRELDIDQVGVDFVEENASEYKGRKRGPKSQYDPKYAQIARVMCAQGATDTVLADAFNVCSNTILNWQAEYPAFKEAVAYGKAQVFDPLVERSLAMRAIGYSVDTEDIKVTKDGDVLRIPVRKHYPPDVTACIFWLKNRRPELWRDVWKIETTNKTEMQKLDSEQLLQLIKEEMAELGIDFRMLTKLKGVAPPPDTKLN